MESERFVPFVLYTERIAKNIKRLADKKMAPYGIRSAHIMCILQLAKTEGGLSSTALADACGVDKAFISRITSELMEKEYIKKDEENAVGKYKTKLILTEKGEKINRVIVGILDECFREVDARLTQKKLGIFYDVLERVDNGIAELL